MTAHQAAQRRRNAEPELAVFHDLDASRTGESARSVEAARAIPADVPALTAPAASHTFSGIAVLAPEQPASLETETGAAGFDLAPREHVQHAGPIQEAPLWRMVLPHLNSPPTVPSGTLLPGEEHGESAMEAGRSTEEERSNGTTASPIRAHLAGLASERPTPEAPLHRSAAHTTAGSSSLQSSLLDRITQPSAGLLPPVPGGSMTAPLPTGGLLSEGLELPEGAATADIGYAEAALAAQPGGWVRRFALGSPRAQGAAGAPGGPGDNPDASYPVLDDDRNGALPASIPVIAAFIQRTSQPQGISPRASMLVARLLQRDDKPSGGAGSGTNAGAGANATLNATPRAATYLVTAKTLKEAATKILARKEAAETTWAPTYTTAHDSSGTVTKVTIDAHITVTMPNWPGATALKGADKTRWDTFITALKKHEDGHVALAQKKLQEVGATMLGQSEADAATTFKQVISDLQQDSDAYDAANDHGRNEGVVIDIDDETPDKNSADGTTNSPDAESAAPTPQSAAMTSDTSGNINAQPQSSPVARSTVRRRAQRAGSDTARPHGRAAASYWPGGWATRRGASGAHPGKTGHGRAT